MCIDILLMNDKIMAILATFVILLTKFIIIRTHDNNNDSPIIGILAQESEKGSNWSEISGVYVNFLHAAGCRAAPILIDQEPNYYETMFNSINGIIIPGTYSTLLDPTIPEYSSSLHMKTAKTMYKMAIDANDRGDYFPIFASCHGCETLLILLLKQKHGKAIFTNCDAWVHTSKLDFLYPLRQIKTKTRLFQYADMHVLYDLAKNNISLEGHRLCLTEDGFKKWNLDSIMKPTTTTFDKNGLKHYTTLEVKKYPFECLWIHPEVTLFSSNDNGYCKEIVRSEKAIEGAQYFTRFMANEARRSNHYFKDKQLEKKSLIFAYDPTYTPNVGDCSPQTYYIPIKAN